MKRRDAGFTLLELLVAMALLALLMVLLFGGLRFGARAWDSSQAHSTGMDEVRLVQGELQREIEQAYPYWLTTDPLNPSIDFHGAPDSMNFLAPVPQVVAGGGRARIAFERRGDGRYEQLMMRAEPELSSGGNAWEEPLLRNIAFVGFSYYGSENPDEPPVWHDRWDGARALPTLIRVHVAFPKGDARVWPELIVAPHIVVDANCNYDASTKRCQGRQ
jgi:general secretion pathway protein J